MLGTMRWIKWKLPKTNVFCKTKETMKDRKTLWVEVVIFPCCCDLKMFHQLFQYLQLTVLAFSTGFPWVTWDRKHSSSSKNLHYFHTKCWNPFSFTGHWRRWLIRAQKCLIFWYLPCTFTSHGLEEQKRPRPASLRSKLRAWKPEFLEEVFGYWEGPHLQVGHFFFVKTLGSWSFFSKKTSGKPA